MSQLSQRRGLCLSGWEREGLGMPNTAPLLPAWGSSDPREKAVREERRAHPCWFGGSWGGKGPGRPELLLGSSLSLRGHCFHNAHDQHLSLDRKSFLLFGKGVWEGVAEEGTRYRKTFLHLPLPRLGFQGSLSPCLLGIVKGSFYETLYHLVSFVVWFFFLFFLNLYRYIYILKKKKKQ